MTDRLAKVNKGGVVLKYSGKKRSEKKRGIGVYKKHKIQSDDQKINQWLYEIRVCSEEDSNKRNNNMTCSIGREYADSRPFSTNPYVILFHCSLTFPENFYR